MKLKTILVGVLMIHAGADRLTAQELGVDAGIVQACYENTPAWDVTPDCVGYAANICQELPGGSTTQGISACLSAETAVWDDILNDAYQAKQADFNARDAMGAAATPAELIMALRDAQRAWISFRDSDCELRYVIFQGGSIRSIVGSGCRLSKTAQRALELRDMGAL